MIPKIPETPGAIRAQITYLRNRKVVLEQVIRSLEQYQALATVGRKEADKVRNEPSRLAGVA